MSGGLLNLNLKRTPCFDQHVKIGGKMVPFAGWEMPVQYTGVIAEHNQTRQNAGIFDVSHMGEIIVTGDDSLNFLEYVTCNKVSNLYDGKAQYNALLNADGGVVDDIIIYQFRRNKFLICVNASNTDKDFAWLVANNKTKAIIKNESMLFGQIAIQGPKALDIVSTLEGGNNFRELGSFCFLEGELQDIPVITARTGYTGEDGFEIFCSWDNTQRLWDILLTAGTSHGLAACGLGARDTLRLEACYSLYGHELREEISALESGLGWIVKFDKGDFIGRNRLSEEMKRGSSRKLVGFIVKDQGIVREGSRIYSADGDEIGFVTSGTRTPTINRSLGLAIINSEFSNIGIEVFCEVRGKKLASVISRRPFYSSRNKFVGDN